MSKSISLTITEDERAELEALLDAYLAESGLDKATPAPVREGLDHRLAESKRAAENQARAEQARRLEWQLEHEAQQRESDCKLFWLQVENDILRAQCDLPPRAAAASMEEDER